MRRLSLWIRAHPMFGDSTVAVLLFLFDIVFTGGVHHGYARSLSVFLGVLMVAPLVLRRRRPLLTAYLTMGAGLIQLGFLSVVSSSHRLSEVIVRPADIALGICLYTLVAYAPKKQAVLYALWMLIGTFIWAIGPVNVNEGFSSAALLGVMMTMVFAFFWVAGEYLGARRAYNLEVERRLGLLETERAQEARIAVAAERARIARELHDVVAHAVSVMVVHSDGASYSIRTKPELAESALNTISDTGRSALVELRRLLGVLRGTELDESDRAPQPDAGGLADLSERFGLPVRLELSGDVDALPAGVGLNLYRIIQEALTNTLKHAGENASAVVTVLRGEDSVTVRIDDNGTGSGGVLDAFSGGNGLMGMRERAAMHGGTVEAGPRDTGGWRVQAVLPL